MQQDLAVAKSLGDVPGECRAHGNLGSAYFSKTNYKEALTSHRYQLVLAMKCKDSNSAASALTGLGKFKLHNFPLKNVTWIFSCLFAISLVWFGNETKSDENPIILLANVMEIP